MAYINAYGKKDDIVMISNRLSWMFSDGFSINKDDLRNFNFRYEDESGNKLTTDQALKSWVLELRNYVQPLASGVESFMCSCSPNSRSQHPTVWRQLKTSKLQNSK